MRRKAWRAKWYENGKQYSKYFYVPKYGFEEAKRLAIEWREKMEQSGRAAKSKAGTAVHQSGVQGVCWHETKQLWKASIRIDGKRLLKYFSANKLGFEEIKRLAIKWRKMMEGGF